MATRDLARRLARLEQGLWLLSPPSYGVVRIIGGLPPEYDAAAGKLRFCREPGEDQAAFEARVMEAASGAGASFVVIHEPGQGQPHARQRQATSDN